MKISESLHPCKKGIGGIASVTSESSCTGNAHPKKTEYKYETHNVTWVTAFSTCRNLLQTLTFANQFLILSA